MHSAVSLFKILKHWNEKNIRQNITPAKSAELLNTMQADDRTDYLKGLPNEVVRELVKTLVPKKEK